MLLSAFLFYYKADRTDYSVLDRFTTASNATRKTGNEVADYLKTLVTDLTAGASYASVDDLNANSHSIIGTIGDDILVGDSNNNFIIDNAGNDI